MSSEKIFTKYNNLAEFQRIDGSKIKKWELIKQIIECIGTYQKQIPTIAREINMPLNTMKLAIEYLFEKDILAIKSFNRLNFYYKPVEKPCLLADMFYPKTIINNFTIQKSRRYHMDDFGHASHSLPYNHVYGTVNTIYE